MRITTTLTILAVLLGGGLLLSQPGVRETVGLLPGGGFLLNSGWKITAAGTQIPVDTLPMSSALSPDKKFLLVLNAGYNPPTISVIDLATSKETSRTPVPDAWLGLTFNKTGDKVYVGGGSKASVYEFIYASGKLTPGRTFPLVAKPTNADFIGDVAFAPDGRLLYAANLHRDKLLIVNTQSGLVIGEVKTGRRPYRILFHPNNKSFYVSSWTDGAVGHYELATGNLLANTRVGAHSTDMVLLPGTVEDQPTVMARLFVSASNTNSVYSLGVTESGELSRLETINLAMTPRQPLGMTPNGLGVTADGSKLVVACSDANTAALVDITTNRSHVAGFIPTGWYPTAALGLPDGRIAVLNGRGLRSYPNPNGPSPLKQVEKSHEGIRIDGYVGKLQTGTVSIIDAPTDDALSAYTKQTLANTPYSDAKLDAPGTPEGNPVRANGPIKHVIYIVKENRTYDQVLGDMKAGNGDASLTLFGEKVTPNLHKLAGEFVLLDNFYENADVSADGHNWATAAIAPDYTQKFWPNSYAGRRKLYDYEGQEATNNPPAGYLWTNAVQKGVSIRNYGYWGNAAKATGPDGEEVDGVRDPVLAQNTNRKYRPFDLEYTDVKRAKVFLDDLAEFEKAGKMPQLLFVRMGNDHTSGTAAGKVSPLSAAADNDQGVGMIAEGISKSRFWGETAIFVTEDDAQNGADHVDSHRSTAYVISPWVKRKTVNSTMYNQASVLRTMELMLGMNPMTIYDAAARPMFGVFATKPTLAQFKLEAAQTPLDVRNPAKSSTVARSNKLDFHDADAAGDDELNAILWIAIKGSDVPTPVRSRFAF